MWKNILLFLSLSGLLGHHASPITKLYHFVDQKMTWTDAQHHCRERFDDLATVDNLEELERLQGSRIGSDYDDDSMWIGLYDDLTRWRWSHGNQDYKIGQHYGNWDPQEPNNKFAEQNCTIMKHRTGQWNDKSCAVPSSAVCINDEGNYNYVQDKMTWDKAREYCQSNYMELASVRDQTDNGKIFALLESHAWIGLHRYPWSHWSDGSRATFFNWKSDEPNNNDDKQHCVYMIVTSGHFVDFECGSLHQFACQERQKRSTFQLKISTEADLKDPDIQRQFVEQLSAKLAKEGVTGVKLRWVLKDGQDQQSQK